MSCRADIYLSFACQSRYRSRKRVISCRITPLGFQEDVTGDRRGDRTAAAAVRHDDGASVAGPANGGKADKERVVAAMPWQIFVPKDPGGSLCRTDAPNLTGACLSPHFKSLHAYACTPGGTAAAYHHILHSLDDKP